jgi:hypothetical protein
VASDSFLLTVLSSMHCRLQETSGIFPLVHDFVEFILLDADDPNAPGHPHSIQVHNSVELMLLDADDRMERQRTPRKAVPSFCWSSTPGHSARTLRFY